jgi:glutaredoxin-like protein
MIDDQNMITVYGTVWCGDCRRARAFLDRHQIPYRWTDVDRDPAAAAYVESLNHGFRSVPTLIWPDGSVLVEPSDRQLEQKLGIGNAP